MMFSNADTVCGFCSFKSSAAGRKWSTWRLQNTPDFNLNYNKLKILASLQIHSQPNVAHYENCTLVPSEYSRAWYRWSFLLCLLHTHRSSFNKSSKVCSDLLRNNSLGASVTTCNVVAGKASTWAMIETAVSSLDCSLCFNERLDKLSTLACWLVGLFSIS